MPRALGPLWHAKPKAQGIIPDGLRGVDQAATWGKSHDAGWLDGQGSCCLVSHRPWVLGAFKSRRNRGHEANRLWLETGQLRGGIETVMMDGQAADTDLFAECQRQRGMTLRTTPRNNSDHTTERRPMITVLHQPQNRRLRTRRGQTVEPRQGLVTDSFARERCWRRGHRHNRWLFAVMGVTVQMHQARALKRQRSVWKMKQEMLGL
jgi:hypothetical protein